MGNSVKEMKAANMIASDAIGEHILGNKEAKQQLDTGYQEFDKKESIISSMDLNNEEKTDIAAIDKLHNEFEDSGKLLWEAIIAANFKQDEGVNAAMKKYDESREKLNQALEEFESMQAAQMKEARTRV